MNKINTRELLDKISKNVNLRELLFRKKHYISGPIPIIIAILIISWLDFSFVLRLQMRALAAINPKIVKLRNDLQEVNSSLIRMQRQETSIADAQVKRMATPGQMSWIIEEISRLSHQQGVRIFQIKPLRARSVVETSQSFPGAAYLSNLIGLELSAGYHQLGRFLAELENHPILLEIVELDIKRSDKGPFEHEVSLKLKTYVSK